MASTPPLRRRPDAAQQLAKLDTWTEQPAANAAAAVTGAGEGAAPEVSPAPPKQKPSAPTPAIPVTPSAPERDKMPWEGLEGQTRPYHIVMPAELYVQLQWLASRNFGSSMRKDVIKVLDDYAKAKLKELGYDRTDDSA